MNKEFIRVSELAEELNVSKTTLWRWRKTGNIPKPINLGFRVVGWRREVLEQWFKDKEHI